METTFQLHNFATRPALIRGAVEAWCPWIESRIGVRLSDAVIIETSQNLAQIGVKRILAAKADQVATTSAARRLDSFLASAEIPPFMPPLLEFCRSTPQLSFTAIFGGEPNAKRSRVEWQDCPIALTFHSVPKPVVVMNIHYQSGPSSCCESETHALVASRDSFEQVIRLLETIDARESTPTLTVYGGEPRKILRCAWCDLVLDPSVISLLKNDYENFWSREQWFRDRSIPFRRGYLLHGGPGGGKSTSIRAMMSSRNLNAFTLRFFEPQSDDRTLEGMFDAALSERPAMIILEDLDRAFPRTGESRTQVSLQALLNHLDGVASGEGLVIVATANDPAALDPAILQRPGRFDRVVEFSHPTSKLRRDYFLKMKLNLEPVELDRPVAESAGYSYAQLRECTILAAQFAFERKDKIRAEDLLRGVHVLRETMTRSSALKNRTGFAPSDNENEAA